MLDKIETMELMTIGEAREKYRNKYIRMAITEIIDNKDADIGYVIYIADKEYDFYGVSRDDYKDKLIAGLVGSAAEPYPIIGNVVYNG